MASLPDKFRSVGIWDAVSIGVGGMVGGPRAYLIAEDFVILYVGMGVSRTLCKVQIDVK